jgi:hypothetical protein
LRAGEQHLVLSAQASQSCLRAYTSRHDKARQPHILG